MKTMTIYTPAKINLFLDVTGKRDDGYHDIVSVMMPVSLYDTVSVTREEGRDELRVFCDVDVCAEQDNIAYKAAKLYFEHTGIRVQRTRIDIEKRIPAQAGLAGGSTDAAAVLIALDELCGTRLSEEELCALGKKLGADVPFCIVKRPMLTEGIGEIFTPVADLPKCTLLIAKDGEGVSTKEAYAKIDEIGCAVHRDHTPLLHALESGDLAAVGECTYNIFEEAVFPVRERAKALFDNLKNSGAVFTRMSGSGPSILAAYTDEATAQKAADALAAQGITAYICDPL